ncbi:UDP-glycosyltransferase 708G2-like [Elaeis guineensis]|uniref:Glycosyltransferase n=1 Tax=Elaeis guineensis var. tenera TaxID=51953 RepID=A0A6I9RLX1_ELAGV|nr:UDP-glycosyltransferase 13-like [Elaeis guineensis]XP_010929048.2 UDP-glycosyltransferase 13-like [Elaeis guineensis]
MSATSGDAQVSHVALLPSAGMGHLTPFLRLASTLASHGCRVTFIAIHPTVSSAESLHLSALFSTYPQIHPLEFPLLHLDAMDAYKLADPFYLHCESIRRSAHLLLPLLTSLSPPLSSFIVDISLASAFIPIANKLDIPSYILFTSSATMLTLFAYLPGLIADAKRIDDVAIPGMQPLPASMIPPALHDPTNLFTKQFIENGRALLQAKAILVNTFESLEADAVAALNGGAVVRGLPPVVAIGPLHQPAARPSGSPGRTFAWLDAQPARSVVYVSFGSRTALSRAQIKELGVGLERSGCRFLWVVKSKIVDREDGEGLEELVGNGLLERGRGRGKGLVVKGWVDQNEVLGHGAVGGFVSHCGWNSVVEAAACGVRILAWPRGADQRVNASLVERSGLGVWAREWGWDGEEGAEVVRGEEIGQRVRELLGDTHVGESVARVREEALRASGVGGSSYEGLADLIEKWRA